MKRNGIAFSQQQNDLGLKEKIKDFCICKLDSWVKIRRFFFPLQILIPELCVSADNKYQSKSSALKIYLNCFYL